MKFSINDKYVVLGFKNGNLQLRRKLLDMGLVKGTIFQIKKAAPFGNCFVIFLRNYYLCIDKANLDFVNLSLVQ
ncbi:MAG: ferrous iron transport protein A [Bacilli bacterium]|nr:ferrous iron transport protein A [Bacilli bacterium]